MAGSGIHANEFLDPSGTLALYRSGVIINRNEHKARAWAKLLVFPLKNDVHSLEGVVKVLLTTVDTVNVKSQSTRSFHVRLAMNEGWVLAGKYGSYDHSLKTAEELAEFLGLPLEQNVRM